MHIHEPHAQLATKPKQPFGLSIHAVLHAFQEEYTESSRQNKSRWQVKIDTTSRPFESVK
jgi:hypothetical protein